MSNKMQFQGYVESYLNKYLKKNKINESFNAEFYDYLSNRILDISSKTILTLLYVFKKENLLEGNTPKERYNYFDNYSKTDDFHTLVDKMYPLLSLRLDRVIANNIINYKDLKERAGKDMVELFRKFGFSMDTIENCYVKYGVSDAHKGSQTICIIENNNKKIVYKPRTGKIDNYWGVFINWFNSKNPSLELDTNKVLDKEDYHWQEYVENKPCKSESELKRLYYRIGILSAISYILKIEDLHMENIMVDQEYPYLVDLETIFQLDNFQNSNLKIRSATDILNKKVRQSILSTQLFPAPSKFHDSTVDISGITGKGGQIIKNGKIKTINQFTDEIRVIRVDNTTKSKSNIGRLRGNYIDPKDYIKDILEGFKEGYILLENNKEELLKLINSQKLFGDIYPRYLFRNTNLYGMILEMSKNPKYLKEKSSLDRLYNFLVNNSQIHMFKNVYQSEVSDLLNEDIPYFYGHINDRSVYNSNGDTCFLLDKTPLAEVKERIHSLNEKDMYIQIDFIIKSMTNQKKTWNLIRGKMDYNISESINSKKSLIEAAKDIGDTLISKATIDEKTETISWLDIQNTFPTWTIKGQDAFLYSGLAGNAIFFSSLYLETKDIKYKNILKKILNTIRLDFEDMDNKPISAFNGVISLVYLYAFLYKQTKDKNMLQLSCDIISEYQEVIFENDSYDIIDGLAGVLVIVLNLYELNKDKKLEDLSIQIGKDIIQNIQIKNEIAYWNKDNKNELMIAGFSHGLAGVTYALGKLYKLTDYKESISTINSLIGIENNYYNDDIKNWIDLRSQDILNPDDSPIHWCHGATGIGLSRLKIKDIINTSDDLQKALEAVKKDGLYCDSDCLCHGNLGNIELLLEIYRQNDDINLYNKAIKRTNEIIIENKFRNGYRNGVGQEFDSPSLMLGLSGIGYEMLRVLDPMKYPSILLLEV